MVYDQNFCNDELVYRQYGPGTLSKNSKKMSGFSVMNYNIYMEQYSNGIGLVRVQRRLRVGRDVESNGSLSQ